MRIKVEDEFLDVTDRMQGRLHGNTAERAGAMLGRLMTILYRRGGLTLPEIYQIILEEEPPTDIENYFDELPDLTGPIIEG